MCVTWGPLEFDVEFKLEDSVKGFNRSISWGLGPDTGRLRRLSSTLRSLTKNFDKTWGKILPRLYKYIASLLRTSEKENSPFMSSSFPRGLRGGCSEGFVEEFEGAGLGAFTLPPLTLPASLAPLLVKESGFWAAGRIICGYCEDNKKKKPPKYFVKLFIYSSNLITSYYT